MKKPLILDIKGNSLDDGPGIRSAIFFKGCPLACVWCHNPESRKTGVELSYDAKACIDHGACSKRCEVGALSKRNPYYVDRAKCSLCFDCVDVCPSTALSRVGNEMSVEEILSKVIKDKPFYDNSGGGVTISGGEPTLYMEFATELLKQLKSQGIQTLLETCGHFNFEKFKDLMLPFLDIIYFDIKIFDKDSHKQYCGKTNTVILENFSKLYRYLSRSEEARKVELLPRIPLIPTLTDNELNIYAIANYLSNLGVTQAAQLSYNPLWHEKSDKIGVDNPCKDDTVMKSWIEQEKEARCREIFIEAGIDLSRD